MVGQQYTFGTAKDRTLSQMHEARIFMEINSEYVGDFSQDVF